MSDLYKYEPGHMDWFLLNWMSRMQADGELNHTLSLGLHTPLAFLNFMAQRALYFRLDGFNNVTYAAWFEPIMGNCFMSFYVSPSVRNVQEEKVFFLFDMINMAFAAGVRTIVGLIQERDRPELTQKFIKLHLRLGYEYCGRVPYLFDNKHCYVVAYTIENWEAAQHGRWQSRWRRDRELASATAPTGAALNGTDAGEQQLLGAVGGCS